MTTKHFPRKIRVIITLVLVSSTLAVSWAIGRRVIVEKPVEMTPSLDAVRGISPARMEGWKSTGLDGWLELSKVLNAMHGLFPLHATGHIDLINNENDRCIERQPFTLDCADSVRARYLIASQQMISDGGMFLAIDQENKVILLQKGGSAIQKVSPFEQLRALLDRQRDTLQVMVNDRGEHMLYSPGFTNGDMSMLQLYYNSDSYKIQKVVLYQVNMGERQDNTVTTSPAGTAESPAPYYVNRVEFIYNEIQKGQMLQGHYYDAYIRLNGTNATLAPTAHNYRLINTLQPKSPK